VKLDPEIALIAPSVPLPAPETSMVVEGLAVPIPTLLPETTIGELVTVVFELGPNIGTVFTEVVPDVVTVVCAIPDAAVRVSANNIRAPLLM
jgi:hypothetical protein